MKLKKKKIINFIIIYKKILNILYNIIKKKLKYFKSKKKKL